MARLSVNARAYARDQIANVLGFPINDNSIPPGLEDQVFREISRRTEIETPTRDSWGNWDFSFGESNLDGRLYEPWLDLPLAEIRDAATGGAGPEPLWPEDKPFAVCLTHDVDYITLQPSFRKSFRSFARDGGLLFGQARDRSTAATAIRNLAVAGFQIATLKVLRPKPERTYDEWVKLEDRHGFKSTFLFFPQDLSRPHVYDCQYRYDDPAVFEGRRVRVRDMMRELSRSGWDIGLHGSYHSATHPGLLREQKQQVEEAIGTDVVCTRQHWLHYDARVTPKLQADAGLRVDSTQGFNRNVGFRAGTSFPYWCWDLENDSRLPVLEVPQHVMDGALFTPNALELDVDLAVRHCTHLLDRVQSVGGCLTLSWHPNSIQYPHYWAVYEQVLAEAARRGAWGCSMAELHAWWTERSERIAKRSAIARSNA